MERLQRAFDALRPTEVQEEKMLREILIARDDAPRRRRRGGNPVRVAALIAAALALCVVTASAAEALGVSQMIRDYFQQKEETSIMDTLNVAASGLSTTTEDGWRITMTDLFGDTSKYYMGIVLEAPEGTVLDKSNYRLYVVSKDPSYPMPIEYDDPDDPSTGWEYYEAANLKNNFHAANQIADDDPNDNKLSFVLQCPLKYYEDGTVVDFTFESLVWPEKNKNGNTIKSHTVKELNASITNVATHFASTGLVIEPNATVDVYGGQTTLKEVRVTPLSLSVRFEGGSAFHRDMQSIDRGPTHPERFIPWCEYRGVSSDRMDEEIHRNWNYACYYDVPIVIHYKDGTSFELDIETIERTVYTDCDKEHGISYVGYSFESIFDLDTVDYITVCDVRVPLTAAK